MPATKEAKQAPKNPFAPVVWDDHQQELEERRKAREANRDVLNQCLDFESAARFEARKPVFEFAVSATFHRKGRKGRMEKISEAETVVAQTKDDAWAKFCDKIGHWPSRKNADVEIKQLAKLD